MPNFVPKGYAFGGGEEREATGGLLPAVASPAGRVDEEDRWLKKTNNTVSLPCLPRAHGHSCGSGRKGMSAAIHLLARKKTAG